MQVRGLEAEYESRITANSVASVQDALNALIDDTIFYPDACAWADQRRWLSKSARYSKWATERTPYLKGISVALASSAPENRVIVVGKAAQMGGSEIGLNEILRRIDTGSVAGILMYMETDSKIESWARDRLKPALSNEVFSSKAIVHRGQTTEFPGGFLIRHGVGTAAGLSSTTAQLVYGDEVSRFPPTIGGEGDWLTLARARITTFGMSGKILAVSTFRDSITGEGVFLDMYESGNQQEYFVPCLHCGELWLWELEALQIVEGRAVMKCPNCGELTEDGEEREKCVAQGAWAATAERSASDLTSFRINGFIAPAEWRPWIVMHEQHERALAGQASLQGFYNAELGLPFNEPEARIPEKSRMKALLHEPPYRTGEVPDAVDFLTLAIDVQRGYIRYEVKGWSAGLESWSIEQGDIQVDITDIPTASASIRRLMERSWTCANGDTIKIWLGCIDEGYQTSSVHEIINRYPQPIVETEIVMVPAGSLTPTRGGAVKVAHRILLGVPGSKTSSGRRRVLKFWRLGTDIIKRELYLALSKTADDQHQNRPHCPIDYPEEYYSELTAEQIKTLRNAETGRVEQIFYLPPRTANEALDLHVMNRAAVEIIGANTWTEPVKWESVRSRFRKPKVKTLEKAPSSRAKKRAERKLNRARNKRLRGV